MQININDREIKLQNLQQEAELCQKCPISKTRDKLVFSDGNPHARVFIVGEGPGEQEDRTGIPFYGPAGELLNKMLTAINLDRQKDVYIGNVIRCRATEIKDGRTKNRPPSVIETENCSNFLPEQINLVKPEFILALGSPAAKSLLNDSKFKITSGRGRWYFGPQNIPVIVTFHPAYLLRLQPPKDLEEKRLVWNDLKMLRNALDGKELPSIIETPNQYKIAVEQEKVNPIKIQEKPLQQVSLF